VNNQSKGSKTGLEPIAKRVAIERKIDLRFPNFEGLVTGVSANLSTSGMFIQSENPETAGTEFIFALMIDEWSPIQGSAKVIWTRTETESPERPAGMGVQFVDLDAQSRRMIRWLVDKHLQEGGKPFDLDTVPAGASKYASGKGRAAKRAGSRRQQSAGKSLPTGRRSGLRRLLPLLILVILAATVFGAYQMWLASQTGKGRLRPPVAETEGGAQPAASTETVGLDEPRIADDAAISSATTEAVTSFIQSWAAAWQNRDVANLMALYADEFDAAAYGGRQQWESEIAQQMGQAEYIRVAVSALEIDFPAANTATATFYRSFRSNTSDETRRMVLELKPTGGGWQIHSERFLD